MTSTRMLCESGVFNLLIQPNRGHNGHHFLSLLCILQKTKSRQLRDRYMCHGIHSLHYAQSFVISQFFLTIFIGTVSYSYRDAWHRARTLLFMGGNFPLSDHQVQSFQESQLHPSNDLMSVMFFVCERCQDLCLINLEDHGSCCDDTILKTLVEKFYIFSESQIV